MLLNDEMFKTYEFILTGLGNKFKMPIMVTFTGTMMTLVNDDGMVYLGGDVHLPPEETDKRKQIARTMVKLAIQKILDLCDKAKDEQKLENIPAICLYSYIGLNIIKSNSDIIDESEEPISKFLTTYRTLIKYHDKNEERFIAHLKSVVDNLGCDKNHVEIINCVFKSA